MAIRTIVTTERNDPVLRTPAKPVKRMTAAWAAILEDMVETMRDAPGVGLAAPQVGLASRLIVVETPVDPEEPEGERRLWRLADPVLSWTSVELEEDQEACLSIPGLYGDVPRHVAVRVRAIDVSGRRVEIHARDFEARVFQHEIDHLDGVLFPDRVTGIDKLYHLEEDGEGNYVRVPYKLPLP
jgi:peptide deformylase